MSVVTDVLLCFHCIESDRATETIDAWLQEKYYGVKLARLDEHATGTKYMQARVYGTSINFLDVQGFIDVVRATKWVWPEYVQLFMKEEDDTTFTDRFVPKTAKRYPDYCPQTPPVSL